MASLLHRSHIRMSLMTLLMAALAASAGDASSQSQPFQQQRIEITLQDKTFLLEKSVPIQVGQTIELIVHNHDPVRHGFVSASLLDLLISGEDDQIMTYGKGVEGFYVNPGKTLIIKIDAERPGPIPFHCDLHEHEQMKGELYVLEVPMA
jgi:FtsP/CotA-like multicopper oxidase with cupredoxin domain